MREIVYRGGVVTFRIPAHWVEEHEADGTAIFYDPAQGSGMLRLTVLTMRSPVTVTPETVPGLLRSFERGPDAHVQALPDGHALLSYTSRVTDTEGNRLVIRYWELGSPLPPDHARLAVFSYTVLESEFGSSPVQDTLALLREEITQATFAADLGEIDG